MDGMIDVSGVDVRELVRAAYELSAPKGLGFMHFTPEPLSDAEVDAIIGAPDYSKCLVSMDYVNGRCCKFGVWQDGDTLTIRSPWFDHSAAQLTALLARVGVTAAAGVTVAEHNPSCECGACPTTRGD